MIKQANLPWSSRIDLKPDLATSSFWVLLAITVLSGGASRADSAGLLVLRPVTIGVIAAMAAFGPRWIWTGMRTPMVLLAILAAWMVVQLIPLPPSLWAALPGHAPLLDAARMAGESQPWRPITLTPDLGLNALLSLLTVLAVLTTFAGMPVVDRYKALTPLLAVAVVSAIMGIIQVSSGTFYFYRRTYESFAVGFFSNRNHHAVFLAMAIPMLRVWTLIATDAMVRRRRLAIAIGCAVLIVPTILLSGSRAGIALGLFAVVATLFIDLGCSRPVQKRRALAVRLAVVAGIVTLVAIVAFAGRAISFERLAAAEGLGGGLRTRAIPVMLTITRDFFPFGTGFGSFDPVFRMYEPDALLAPGFFNHAHNDLIEIVLTGGLPAVLIALGLAAMLLRCAVRVGGGTGRNLTDVLFLRLAIIMWLMIVAASLVDYPLRSPLMMAVMSCATLWATSASSRLGSSARADAGTKVA